MLVRYLILNGVMVSLDLSPTELNLINNPDTSLLGLNPSEVFVEGEVVTDRILEKENIICTLYVIIRRSNITFQVWELVLKYLYLSWNQM